MWSGSESPSKSVGCIYALTLTNYIVIDTAYCRHFERGGMRRNQAFIEGCPLDHNENLARETRVKQLVYMIGVDLEKADYEVNLKN